MRIVKKTLKGDLMGRTGFKKVGPARAKEAKEAAAPAPPAPDGAAGIPEDPEALAIPLEEARRLPTRLKPSTQKSLDALVKDDDLVVITEPLHPRHGRAIVPTKAESERPQPSEQEEAPRPPRAVIQDGEALPLARSVLADALYRDVGEPGSKMEHRGGTMFHLHPKFGHGAVRTRHTLMLPLPEGNVVPHTADLVIELENKAVLVLDCVASSIPVPEMKALGFDALQMRSLPRAFSILLYVRVPGHGLDQALAEAIGHGFDYRFGIDEAHVHDPARMSALRARIHTWLQAASQG